MNCPVCESPLVQGTAIDGDERRTYSVCPTCSLREYAPAAVELPHAPAGFGAKDEQQLSSVITGLLTRVGENPDLRPAAAAALQRWHSDALRIVIATGSARQKLYAMHRLKQEFADRLRGLLGEGGVM